MHLKFRLAIVLAIASAASASYAEQRVYEHSGCTKDHFSVHETLSWDCKGSCKNTPLKKVIMEDAKNSRRVYPEVVSHYTKAQILKHAHASEVRRKANLKTKDIGGDKPKFGGKC